MMKAVMYHYVRPYSSSLPFLRHLHFDDFCKQLDYLQETFGLISKEQFLHALTTGEPTEGAVLTFDDALKCHYTYVYPELKRRNIWGIFYAPTLMYQNQKILDVHRIHILLGLESSELIYNELIKLTTAGMLVDDRRKEFTELTYQHQLNNSTTTNNVKRILNYFISYEHREKIIDKLVEKFVPESVNNLENFYISKAQIKEMSDAGMTIGSHTVSHPVLSKLDDKSQAAEIHESFTFLEDVCNGLEFKTFCYPYGGFHSFTAHTESILNESGCRFSFNVEPRDINNYDLKNRPQALPRYDCNQFPFGECR